MVMSQMDDLGEERPNWNIDYSPWDMLGLDPEYLSCLDDETRAQVCSPA